VSYRVGVDIGGTFTDFTVLDDAGNIRLWKEDSTPNDPREAIAQGLSAIADELDLRPEQFLAETTLLVHGTTIATNTLIERSGPRIGLLCTEGFRDILYFRDGFKPERFNVHLQHPTDLAERYLRIGVPERITAEGKVLKPLDESAVRGAADRFREEQVGAVAVAFLWSIVDSRHELRAAEILAEELPGVHILLSSQILPEIREWQRTSATALSAYIRPHISSYLERFEALLSARGLRRSPLIMQINGGCASVTEILRRPVNVLASGPAAAPAAASFHAAKLGARDLITIDMGGTSFDVCVIRDGRPAMSRTIQVEQQPVGVPGVEVHSVGAGGGSVAWIDSGRALRVGPLSAGARPGPACYGRGGSEPTVTDANVVLGRLAPDAFLGGRRPLERARAAGAIEERIARPLGLDLMTAAAGIIRVVDSNMVDAIRAVSIERGIDPRGFTMVAGGGAGGLHAARLARELGMTRVLIPEEAGTFCALGMTVTDVRHDYAQPFHTLSSQLDLSELTTGFDELEAEARQRLHDDGFFDEQISLERAVDARYPGQVYELTLGIPGRAAYSRADAREIEQAFHAAHRVQFAYAREQLPVEFLHLRVAGIGQTQLTRATSRPSPSANGSALIGEREAYSQEDGELCSWPVYAASLIGPESAIEGPAIIQADTTTILVSRDDRLSVTDDRAFLLEIG
jgi:N-methylhydantoinase A